ncbi:MAG: T9SS type A sorting domain-containing protein [Ignavibacteria bacterium]|nr:T9SS type A sorting domain-containing protein [Ignavibacteria bacterium]
MSKMFLCVIFSLLVSYNSFASSATVKNPTPTENPVFTGVKLPGFVTSPYFNEQICMFNYDPEIRIFINAPSVESFDPNKRTEIALFALPNGNSIEWTIGKKLNDGDDWHYDIQHIGAQTRFLRNQSNETNLVTVYLETAQKSWPSWRAKYPNNPELINNLVTYLKNIFSAYNPFLVLTGHSGGGSFTFGFMNNAAEIPNSVERISFLDSDYNYDGTYGLKLLNWINASPNHFLSVIAYNDSVALFNGQPVVSATGGTWYRSKLMKAYLANHFQFTDEENSDFIKYTALNGRIKFILKQNPQQLILHTVQVELNGFIQGMLSGTDKEGVEYTYYGSRAYTQYVQDGTLLPKILTIPPRPANAISGSQFMQQVLNMTFDQREVEIYNQLSIGNIPDFMRTLTKISRNFVDGNGTSHACTYEVIPDYLSIGSNEDFCRIPMGPITAQKLADLFGAVMPMPKLVDDIYIHALVKLDSVTYPWSVESSLVPKFIEHNAAIEKLRIAAGGVLGQLTGGTKKDVVLSNLIVDPTRPNHVVIYGWHTLKGTPIQPLTNVHINSYVDYSHGIRLLNTEMLVDGVITNIKTILADPVLYKMLSNETGAMAQPTYIVDATLPGKPKSFGIKPGGIDKLKIIIGNVTAVDNYNVYISKDGKNFQAPVTLSPDNMILEGLQTDSIYFIKLEAVNLSGKSPQSEVLAGVPASNTNSSILIVNGFDRSSTGNSYDFVRQHAQAVKANNGVFESATNDAILDGTFNLIDYQIADYILGDESTVDETFSSTEQPKIKSFLNNGGNLFVSGSEIAWDIDYKGSTADKDFAWNYLKMKYLNDAPFGVSATYYKTEPFNNSICTGMPSFFFDNGTHGTIDVKWPDVIKSTNGGMGFLKYSDLDTTSGYAAIFYSGNFPQSVKPGKVAVMGFPFETVYPEAIRNELMNKLLTFFNAPVSASEEKNNLPTNFSLSQNYPNPFNPSTIISYQLAVGSYVSLKVYDVLGDEVATLVNGENTAGEYQVEFDGSKLVSGVYIYRLTTKDFDAVKKFVLMK